MRICDIDFPELLLASQKNGSLAVFAGADVSMPPPSNYPNFNDLANQVAGRVMMLEPDESVGGFLRRLALSEQGEEALG